MFYIYYSTILKVAFMDALNIDTLNFIEGTFFNNIE